MRYKVTEGPVKRPQRVLIYGPEGIGKSTMASQMPNPVFVDVEDGTGHIYARRFPVPSNWDLMVDMCRSVAEDPEDVSTIVIDSVDAAERLCQEAVIKKAKKQSIESWGYGKGYVIAAEEFQKLLDVLDLCIEAGVNVIMIAHSQMRKFERPDEAGAYDRFEVKLNKHVGSKVKEWADAVLFLDYETFVSVDDNGKGHASGGKRVIRTSHNVSWDAKNRWGLPDKLTLDADGVNKIIDQLSVRDVTAKKSTHPNPDLVQDMAKKTAELRAKEEPKPKTTQRKKGSNGKLQPLFDMCQEMGLRPEEVKAVMVERGKREEDQPVSDWEAPFVQWLVKNGPRVKELVIEWRKEHAPKDVAPGEVYDEEIPF